MLTLVFDLFKLVICFRLCRLCPEFLRLKTVTIQLLGCWRSALLLLKLNLVLTLQKFMPILHFISKFVALAANICNHT